MTGTQEPTDSMIVRHWSEVYAGKPSDQTSWFQEEPTVSIRLVGGTGGESLIDVGAGTSRLVDAMVSQGWRVSVLDASAEALAQVRARLGDTGVSFVVGDLLAWTPDQTWDVWHDRAVFHFLTSAADRLRYRDLAAAAVNPGGALVLGCFAEDGPEQCSGLPVARYGAQSLAAEFDEAFTLEHAERELHRTPWGAEQAFTWVRLRRRG